MERTRYPVQSEEPDNDFLYKLIHDHGFYRVSKDLVQVLGFQRACFLSAYIDKYFYFLVRNPNNNGWFYFTKKQEMDEFQITLFTLKKYKTEFIELVAGVRSRTPAMLYRE